MAGNISEEESQSNASTELIDTIDELDDSTERV